MNEAYAAKDLRIVATVLVNGVTREVSVRVGIGSPLGEALMPHIEEEVELLKQEGHFRADESLASIVNRREGFKGVMG